MQDKEYDIVIEKGRHEINDQIFEILLPRIKGSLLDIGCNTGYLMEQYQLLTHNPVYGVDKSSIMVEKALEKKIPVYLADATCLPFDNDRFDTVVLSCILEQTEYWEASLDEAIRVCRPGGQVLVINPTPNNNPWGYIGGWVKSIISASDMTNFCLARGLSGGFEELFNFTKYLYTINK